MQTKPKGVTTQMKALDEYILMVLFVLLLQRVHFLVNKTSRCLKAVFTEVKALMLLLVIAKERVVFKQNLKV